MPPRPWRKHWSSNSGRFSTSETVKKWTGTRLNTTGFLLKSWLNGECLFNFCYYIFVQHYLGCWFPVSSADFWLCLCKFCGVADRGRLAGQRREFKTYRKSTAQMIWPTWPSIRAASAPRWGSRRPRWPRSRGRPACCPRTSWGGRAQARSTLLRRCSPRMDLKESNVLGAPSYRDFESNRN